MASRLNYRLQAVSTGLLASPAVGAGLVVLLVINVAQFRFLRRGAEE